VDTLVKVDGRRARGLRTRDAIVGALMDLVAEGDLSPTAQRIADRAGVSVRSVYQHFADVEGLFQETAERTRRSVVAMRVPIDPSWPLDRRVDAFAQERSTVLEAITPFSRAARLIEPTSTALQQSRLHLERQGREELELVFAPELDRLAPQERLTLLWCLDLLTTWSAWDHLRNSGAGPKEARRVMRSALLAVLIGLRI
jgi:TetR/AcrR family transcriptional regulator, regulator of autoinduction and epiphytic fitness